MRITKGHIKIFFLLTAGLLVGCGHHNEPEQKNEIAVNTGVTGMQKRVSGTPNRVASIDNNTALQAKDLKIDAYFHDTDAAYLEDAKLHYTGGSPAWVFWDGSAQEHYYWPIDGSVYDPEGENITYTSLDFVGLCPYDLTNTGVVSTGYKATRGDSIICDLSSYMTLAAQASMQECLMAVAKSQTLATQEANSGAVPMSFKHPFALIKFIITAASGTHVQIDSISIPGLYTGGSCRYDGSDMYWEHYTGSAAMKMVQTLKNGGTTESSYFMVIPANYGSKYLTVSATWDDWSDVSIRNYGTNVTFEWEPGRTYTYNLTLDKYGLKVDVHKFTEQW